MATPLPPLVIDGGSADPGEIRSAQIATFSRQTPVNIGVTVSVSILTAGFLWPVAPKQPLLIWTGLQVGLSILVFGRWYRRRHRPIPRSVSLRGVRHAAFWAGSAGLLWGALATFLPSIPPVDQMAVAVVICGMTAGAATTLAAIPMAATIFIAGALFPPVLWFLVAGKLAYLAVGLEGIVFALSMLAATRTIYTTFIDDLETKQRNTALLTQFRHERQEWFEISETAEGFALLDSDNRLVLWNENFCRFLSIPPDRIHRGANAADLLAEAATPISVAEGRLSRPDWITQQLMPTGSDMDGPVLRLTNGRWLRNTVRRSGSGRVVLLYVDVSELKQAEAALHDREAELRQVQKLEAVGKLAGGVAHDFNNILTVIGGYSDLLIAGLGDQPALLECAEEARRAATRATALTRQLLAFSRKQTLQPRIVDLSLLVAQLEGMLKRVVPENVQMEFDLSGSLGSVLVDPNQMEQVLVNLVVNACDAMPEGGHLRIQTSAVRFDPRTLVPSALAAEDAYILLTVTDTGMGMDAATQERIFEPFFTTKELGHGTGLGLAMVYGTVKQSGGFIGVDSKPGRGTTFKVYLPVAAIEESPAEPVGALTGRPVRGSETVLVVEDEDPVRRLVSRTLKNAGYAVLEAASPLAALDICLRLPGTIHAILTDVVMPEMGGRQFIDRARTIRPETKVLFMSGYTADALGRRGLLDSGVELIEKPFTAAALLIKIRATLDAGPPVP